MVDRNDSEIYCCEAGRKLVNMRRTYPEAYFNFTDTTAAEECRMESSELVEQADMRMLARTKTVPEYAALDLNGFLLDGTVRILEDTEKIPFISSELADEDRHIKQTVDMSFENGHSSIGFTFYFAKQYPKVIQITCYGENDIILVTRSFKPDARTFFCNINVQNYRRIRVEFVETRFPGQYIRWNGVLFGKEWILSRDTIKTASIFEEVDQTGATLPINTAKIEILDTENNFDTKRQDGLWKHLQKKQEICIREYIDGKEIDCGTFYLSEWSSKDNLVNLSFEDIMGLMDKTSFYDGQVYEKETAGNIIDSIMASFGISKYDVDEEVADIKLSGYLGIQSHRAALQQVVFACGALADCSRSDRIHIYHPARYVSKTINCSRKFMGSEIKLDSYVSGVSIEYETYIAGAETEVFKGNLEAGETRVEFTEPCKPESLTVSAGMIVKRSTNYIIIALDEEKECTISGIKYETVTNVVTASEKNIAVGESKNVKKYTGCTLINTGSVKANAERMLDYHKLRQTLSMRIINEGERVGEWCAVEEVSGKMSITGIKSQSIDLTGGFIATATCRGYSQEVKSPTYTGEIRAGERSLI